MHSISVFSVGRNLNFNFSIFPAPNVFKVPGRKWGYIVEDVMDVGLLLLFQWFHNLYDISELIEYKP